MQSLNPSWKIQVSESALQKLRRLLWGSTVALVTSSWGLAYCASAVLAGVSMGTELALNLAVFILTLAVVLDLRTRMLHCHYEPQAVTSGLDKMLFQARFKGLPASCVEGGYVQADTTLAVYLRSIDAVYRPEVLRLANELKAQGRGFSKADVLNLQILASLRQQQLCAGYLLA